jgi:queuosine precursor transporter
LCIITELTTRFHGAKTARRIVYAGFLMGVILSYLLATPKIALASGTAFLSSQLLDILLFSRLRNRPWWSAPLFASLCASLFDAAIFWNLAFLGEDLPLLSLALGDTAIKVTIDFLMLTPFRFVMLKFAT